MGVSNLDDEVALLTERMRSAIVASRKVALKAWLDSDPALRGEIIEGTPELKRLRAHVDKLERMAIGFRERV